MISPSTSVLPAPFYAGGHAADPGESPIVPELTWTWEGLGEGEGWGSGSGGAEKGLKEGGGERGRRRDRIIGGRGEV